MKSSSEARNRAPRAPMQHNPPPVPMAAVSSPPVADAPGPSLTATTRVDADAMAGLETPSGADDAPLNPWLATTSDGNTDEDAGTAPKKTTGKLEVIDDGHNDAPLPPAQASARHEALEEEAGLAPAKAKGKLELIDEDNDGVMPLARDEEMGKTSMKADKGKPRGESPTRLGLEAGQGRAPAAAPGPPVPQAARRIEHTPGGARQRPREEIPRRLPHRPVPPPPDVDEQLDPTIHIPEATLVEEEPAPPLAEAVPVPDPLPVPWWKRHQKCLMGVSAAILAALSVALGVVLSRGEPPTAPPPSDSNFTYYPNRMKRMCSNDPSAQPNNSTEQTFFENAEKCCKEVFWDYQDECFVKSLGSSHRPSSSPSEPPSENPSSSLPPSSPPTYQPSSIPSHAPSRTLRPTLRPSMSRHPTSLPSMTFSPSSIPSMSLATRLQSSALRLVTSEDVAGVQLTSEDAAGGLYGHASTENVAVRGDIAVVGAPNNDNEKGAAFVLKRDETGWSELARLEAPDGKEGDQFGWSVAIDGDTIVVGAHGDNSRKGSAHIFVKIDDSWQHQARLVAPDRNADNDNNDSFGYSVGIHQDRVVIGAHYDDSNGSHAGSAYVFVRNDTTLALEAKLLAPDGGGGEFGTSVGIFSHTIVVGAPWEDTSARKSGAAHIYSRTLGGSWEHRIKLSDPDGSSYDYFGGSVGTHGNHVIVGAPGGDSNRRNAGASFIFSNEGSEWGLEAKLLAPDGTAYDFYGRSVAIFDGAAVVGSPRDDDNELDSGSVHLFELTRGAWLYRAKLLAPDGINGDGFGRSVSAHNGTVIAHSNGSGETFAFSG